MTKRKIIRIIQELGYINDRLNDWSYPEPDYKRGRITFTNFKKVLRVDLGWSDDGGRRYLVSSVTEKMLYDYIIKCNPHLKQKIRQLKLKDILE